MAAVVLMPALLVLSATSAGARSPLATAPSQDTDEGQHAPEPGVDTPADAVPLPETASGDVIAYGEATPDGFVVVAASGGDDLRPVATLKVRGMESSMWTGTTCVTGSGRYVAASFGPVEMLNEPALRDGGAFLAIVDLVEGAVRIVPARVAFKYHTPGCGPTDEVAAVRHTGAEEDGTPDSDLLRVDPATGAVASESTVGGQITNPAPVGDSTYGAIGDELVQVDAGGTATPVAADNGQVFDIHATEDGGVDYLVAGDDDVTARHAGVGGQDPVDIASASLGQLAWAPGRRGDNMLVATPGAVEPADDLALIEAEGEPTAVSLDGELVVSTTANLDVGTAGMTAEQVQGVDAVAVQIASSDASTDSTETVLALDGPSAAHADVSVQPLADPPRNFTDPVCAIPRNDPNIQVMQPSPEQVEWAAHKAVRGELAGVTRPAGWRGYGLPSYTPQGQFPVTPLDGGGRIPAQVLLGVLSQESNLWQAARGALPGIAANPLIGDYYGTVYTSDGEITGMDYNKADCGYGIGQVTDHMRINDPHYSAARKKMIAVDYLANMSVSVQILADKWNQAMDQDLVMNDGDPASVENWYFALWGYNTGIYACCTSPYGVGWTNNPANSDYKPDRQYFLRESLDDARYPQRWPYQEKVLGFAESGLWLYGERAFHPVQGSLNLPAGEEGVVERFEFCQPAVNQCDPNHTPPNMAAAYCTRTDRKCWWHGPKEWFLGPGTPEYGNFGGGGEPAVESEHPPSCTAASSHFPTGGPTSVPSTAKIVDDVPNMSANIVGCGARASQGTFTLSYGTTAGGWPLSRIDTHQIGAGYGGHFYYAHTNRADRASMTTTGTWTPSGVSGWHRIMVHIPDHGADTFQADYKIYKSGASTQPEYHRTVNQRWNANTWIDLGVFQLGAGAKVTLSNVTYSDSLDHPDREIDIAWDAMAFVPAAKPTVSYVAMGDSYSSGEGVAALFPYPYFPDSDVGKATPSYKNECHRSMQSYSQLLLPSLMSSRPGTAFFHNATCSGSKTPQVYQPPGSTGGLGHGEVPQMNQGWLDENTTHVSISIGGNDVGFSDIIIACIVDGECDLSENEDVLENIDVAQEGVREVLAQIKARAPNARIVLVGYPYVIKPEGDVSLNCGMFQPLERIWMRDMSDEFISRLQEEATDAGVRFADVRSRFAGHEACHVVSSNEWVNAFVASSNTGSGLRVPSMASFHPKLEGQLVYAEQVYAHLTAP